MYHVQYIKKSVCTISSPFVNLFRNVITEKLDVYELVQNSITYLVNFRIILHYQIYQNFNIKQNASVYQNK